MVTYLFFDTNVHDTRLDSQPTTTQVGPGPQGRRGRIGQELLGAVSLCRLPVVVVGTQASGEWEHRRCRW